MNRAERLCSYFQEERVLASVFVHIREGSALLSGSRREEHAHERAALIFGIPHITSPESCRGAAGWPRSRRGRPRTQRTRQRMRTCLVCAKECRRAGCFLCIVGLRVSQRKAVRGLVELSSCRLDSACPPKVVSIRHWPALPLRSRKASWTSVCEFLTADALAEGLHLATPGPKQRSSDVTRCQSGTKLT